MSTSKKVLVIGDLIIDKNIHGKVPRLCPEAPIPVFVPETVETLAGGAGLVAANLEALGILVERVYGSESRKTRYFSGHQQIGLRFDEDSISKWDGVPVELLKRLPEFDAVVISDYNKGAISDQDARRIITDSPCPVFVDTKRSNPEVFARCFAIFPNDVEFKLFGDHSPYQHVIHKDGANGCYVDGKHVQTTALQAFDVTGAGDCFLAAFVVSHLNGSSLHKCAKTANKAAGIAVQHVGSYIFSSQDSSQLFPSGK
jgi:bifunctional ADP-heptose synthase (sugar kinase/adenylyltransferase)